MATSYANPGGSGDRRASILLTSALAIAGTLSAFVDGNRTTNAWFFSVGSPGNILEFWFSSPKILDEATWYQSNTVAHGTWKWQGSNDRTTWTDLGGTFTLGGVTTQTLTTLAGNTTAYVFYRLFQVSGSSSSSPWIYEIEFKIDEGGTTSYLNPLSSGNRTSTITASSSGISWFGSAAAPSALVNGSTAQDLFWDAAAVAGHWIRFDFGAAYLVQQARWLINTNSSITTDGSWKLQGSPDASAWTDVSAAVTITSIGSPAIWYNCFGQAALNTTPYRYYRVLGVSGSRTGTPWLLEVEFMVAASAAPSGPPPRAETFLVLPV